MGDVRSRDEPVYQTRCVCRLISDAGRIRDREAQGDALQRVGVDRSQHSIHIRSVICQGMKRD